MGVVAPEYVAADWGDHHMQTDTEPGSVREVRPHTVMDSVHAVHTVMGLVPAVHTGTGSEHGIGPLNT